MPVIRLDRFGEALFQMAADANLVSAGKCFQDSVEIIGARPGEKLYEELMSDEEFIQRNWMISSFCTNRRTE